MPDDFDKLQAVFLKAVEVENAAARAALLERECAGGESSAKASWSATAGSQASRPISASNRKGIRRVI